MSIALTARFKSDFEKLKKGNPKLSSKVLTLVIAAEDNISTPLEGIGKPEYLKGNLSGCLSRKIDGKHRLIYECREKHVVLLSCYGHYGDK